MSGFREYIGPSRTLHGIARQSEELNYSLLPEELPRFDSENIEPGLHKLPHLHVDGIVWAVPEAGNNRRWVDEIVKAIPVPIVFLTMQPRIGLMTVSQMSLSVLQLANRIGMNIPGELAVVGVDAVTESPYFTPALTAMNNRAASRMVSRIATPKNCAASPAFLDGIGECGACCGVFILPRKRDKPGPARTGRSGCPRTCHPDRSRRTERET
jgi:DNA-binding LacI/PurR family transcriptional regulator